VGQPFAASSAAAEQQKRRWISFRHVSRSCWWWLTPWADLWRPTCGEKPWLLDARRTFFLIRALLAFRYHQSACFFLFSKFCLFSDVRLFNSSFQWNNNYCIFVHHDAWLTSESNKINFRFYIFNCKRISTSCILLCIWKKSRSERSAEKPDARNV
jgi:hypothetical protein